MLFLLPGLDLHFIQVALRERVYCFCCLVQIGCDLLGAGPVRPLQQESVG